MLQLHAQNDFCKIIFKIKHKIIYGLDSAPTPCSGKFWVHIWAAIFRVCVMGTVVAVSGGVTHSCTVCIYTGC